MRECTNRRFGAHEVTKGKWKGGLHVATKAYTTFRGEILYLNDYLNRRLLPRDPEDVDAAAIMLNLQNILEYELELAITNFVNANKTAKNQAFLERINSGFVSFKTKFEWALAKKLIAKNERDAMEQIRSIRNEQTHARPKSKRTKYKYFGQQLLTRKAIARLFTDVNDLTLKLRSMSGNREKWPVIPPGYAEEMGWYGDKPKKANAV